jgi:hypothetical protein
MMPWLRWLPLEVRREQQEPNRFRDSTANRKPISRVFFGVTWFAMEKDRLYAGSARLFWPFFSQGDKNDAAYR